MGQDANTGFKLDDITQKERETYGVSALATRPNAPSRYGEGGLTAKELKAKFDALSGLLADRINNIHNYLRANDLDEKIKITALLDDEGKITLSELGEYLLNGKAAAKYINVYDAQGLNSLQQVINDILYKASKDAENNGNNFLALNVRADGLVQNIVIDTVVSLENITVRLTRYSDNGAVLGSEEFDIPNAPYLIYEHDKSADAHQDIRGLIQSNVMQIDSLREDIADVRAVAEGRVRARAYSTWDNALLAISSLDTLEEARKEFAIGDQIYIRTPKSTDAWVSGFETRHEPYPGGLGDDLDPFDKWESTEIHVGYLIISPLEAPDIDLTGYVTTDDFDEYGEKVGNDIADAKADSIEEAKAYTAEEVAGVSDRVDILDKKVENIRSALSPEYFTEDSTVAYTKTVPDAALPFAEVKEVGGMSYAEGGEIKNAAVTAIESEGENLIDLRQYSGETIFRLDIGKHLPAGVTYQISAVGTTEHPTDTQMLVAYSDSAQDKTKSIKYFTAGQRTYLTFVPEFDFNQIIFYGAASYQNSLNVKFTITDAMLTKGANNLPFAPYSKHTLPIPAEVQALEGWGMGVNETYHNRLDWEKKQYRQEVAKIRLPSNAGGYNATNNWYYLGFADSLGVVLAGKDVLCNLLPSVNIEGSTSAEGICINYSKTHVILRINGFADQAAYRTWLSANEVYIVAQLASPIVTDLPNLSDDNFIEVEGGGTITAVNEHELAAPTKIEYQLKEATA